MRTTKRFAFDLSKAIPAAWDFCWKNALKHQGSDYRASRDHYLTASAIEAQVRQFAYDTSQGKPWGDSGAAYSGNPYGIRLSGDVNGRVRRWLLSEVSAGRLQSHNFGRGHISGMRFRPAGVEVTKTEKATMARREARMNKPRPCHMYSAGGCLCSPKKVRWTRSNAWTTRDATKVTCTRCNNLLLKEKAA